ncbi:MAG: hypothetical protein U0325_36525 [Polyangiales bacterium]
MRRFVGVLPRFRMVLTLCALVGGLRTLPDCNEPPVSGTTCVAFRVASNGDHTCALLGVQVVCNGAPSDGGAASDGGTLGGCFQAAREVRCWGDNSMGQAGQTERRFFQTPVRVDLGLTTTATQSAPGILALATGRAHTCVILQRGTVRCWGSDANGRLGGGTRQSDVPGLREVTQIAAGAAHTCALLQDRTVRCWGGNASGQAGRPASDSVATPTEVGLSDVTAITAGAAHTCAVQAGGQVWCWGSNADGQLGIGSAPSSDVPVMVPLSATGAPLFPEVIVYAGERHTCARLSDGTARCWGYNNNGQLGDGTTTSRMTPVTVPGLGATENPVTSLAAGAEHTCAGMRDGTVRCWGANDKGQLGNNSTTRSTMPVAVADLTRAIALSAGASHTCAHQVNGTVRCWGGQGLGGGVQRFSVGNAPGPELQCCLPTPAAPGGACVDTQNDSANCGTSGNTCPSGRLCRAGGCACPAPLTTCGAACVDVSTNVSHCGLCNNACPTMNASGAECRMGACAISCGAGRGDCNGMIADGCETDLQTTVAHCGACGRACAPPNADGVCRAGACAVMACRAGFTDCDGRADNGCEATLTSDSNHCGACGNACGGANSTSTCTAGVCGRMTCNAGFKDCDNDRRNGCETPSATMACAVPAATLPTGSRVSAGGHTVNIVDAAAAAELGPFLQCPRGRTCGLEGLTRAFYRYYSDDYDFVIFVAGAAIQFTSPCPTCDPDPDAAEAATEAVRRPAFSGTGVGPRSNSTYAGLAPVRLRAVIGANQGSVTSSPATLHEILHYWGVELKTLAMPGASPRPMFGPGRFEGHWGVSSVRGQLDGFDPSTATCIGGGTFPNCTAGSDGRVRIDTPPGPTGAQASCLMRGRTAIGWSTIGAPGDVLRYAPLELYLMGLVGSADAGGPWYVLDGARDISTSGFEAQWSGTALRRVTIADVIAANGDRAPAPVSEKAFRTAVAVFSAAPVDAAWLANVERWASILGNQSTDPCLMSFETATGGRATMSTTLGATRLP